MTVVSIHQVPYFPWFGIVDKICRSDVFVVLDTVQYNKRSFQHRTLYSSDRGGQYLSLSINSKGAQTNNLLIADTTLADPALPARHLDTLRHRYGRTPGWSRVKERLEDILQRPWERLIDLNLAVLTLTLDVFAIAPRLVKASELAADGRKGDLMLALTQAAGGDVYLSGTGAHVYMDESIFAAAGCGLEWQSFVHPTFRQSHGGAFVPGCLALEWYFEDPDNAAGLFQAHATTHGGPPPRCFHPAPSDTL